MVEDKSTKGIASLLLSFGLTWRATILLFVFITLFNVFSVVFVYLNDRGWLMVWAAALIPLVVINVILGIALINPTLKGHLLAEETVSFNKVSNRKAIGRKAYLSFACYGTFVALTIVLFVVVIVLNLINYIDYIIPIWLFIGCPVICKSLWNFYSNRLK